MLDLVIFAISRAMGIDPYSPMKPDEYDEFHVRFAAVTKQLEIGIYEPAAGYLGFL